MTWHAVAIVAAVTWGVTLLVLLIGIWTGGVGCGC